MASPNTQQNYHERRKEGNRAGSPNAPGDATACEDMGTPPTGLGFPLPADLERGSQGIQPDDICNGAGSAYQYRPLSDGCIRLLRLMPHPDENAKIQCQLFDYAVLDSGRGGHLYEALSYVWGSMEKPLAVSTDEGYLPVTKNLHAALARLRDRVFPRILWVDAICINQDDIEERGCQVSSMAKIYARANRVIIWLEEAPADGGQVDVDAKTDGDRALGVISAAADGRLTQPSENDRQAVLALLRLSWFRRIWVWH